MVRKLLQFWGEQRRNEDINYWIKKLEIYINSYTEGYFNYLIVPSVRFLNEAEWIRTNGGKILRITRPDTDNHGDTHISETEMDKIIPDFTMPNDGTIDNLKIAVIDILWL